ncbi:cation:proton antiporter [Candidatus Bipolaricaulota bacterium]|nr:cation:proton antiporter [Candidatus Bipolaricaulota bacterium]RLE28997.1 MAG: cation:proton antiporter [Candidatus Acetothermia bacterium]
MIAEMGFLVAATVLVAYAFVSMLRLAAGPTTADRAVALDTINTLVVATMVLLGAAFGQVVLVDVAIVYALLSFIATLYIARYLEGGLK